MDVITFKALQNLSLWPLSVEELGNTDHYNLHGLTFLCETQKLQNVLSLLQVASNSFWNIHTDYISPSI